MNYIINKSETIHYHGNTYHIRIKTCNSDNPVVLFLHGGCGSPDRGQVMKHQDSLSKKFTLVAWDQRGAGFAYDKNEAKTLVLTKEIYVEDTHNVMQYLKHRFHKDKIILVGHSFGSVLGVWTAEKYPDDIAAYVGVGQCIDYVENEKVSYKFTLEQAKKECDKKSVAVLERIGAPNADGKYNGNHQRCLVKQRAILHKLGGATYSNRKPYWLELLTNDIPLMLPEYRLRGLIKYVKGLNYVLSSPLAMTNPDFINTVKELNVPVYLLLGHHDYNCGFELAEKWLSQLKAPQKRIIWFENSAHSPQWEEPEKWNNEFEKLFA